MDEEDQPIRKPSMLPFALATSSLLGAVAFGVTFSGTLISNTDSASTVEPTHEENITPSTENDVQFVKLEPLLITLGSAAQGQQLRFEGYLEVNPSATEEVEMLMPRIMDVLNSYLRAVDFSDISEPSSLLRMRLQMLKRTQIVVGEDKIIDLLVSKFLIG